MKKNTKKTKTRKTKAVQIMQFSDNSLNLINVWQLIQLSVILLILCSCFVFTAYSYENLTIHPGWAVADLGWIGVFSLYFNKIFKK